MQGAFCVLPEPSDHRSTPERLEDMDATKTTSEINNQSDSGIFSAASTTDRSLADRSHSSEEGDAQSPEARRRHRRRHRQHVCPICEALLDTQHAFTLHIRSHNNDGGEEGGGEPPKPADEAARTFTCRICAKVLSSSSSRDRHVLVHSGERPFTCRHCGDTFTTNGNMHRHMRTHAKAADAADAAAAAASNSYESDASVDSTASSGGTKMPAAIEFNNNKVDGKRKLDAITAAGATSDDNDEEEVVATATADDDDDDDEEDVQVHKKAHLEPAAAPTSRRCPVCARDDFASRRSLEVHVEDNHPEYPARCHRCKQLFHNQKRLNYHKMTVHADADGGVVHGFRHFDYVDFSSAKFPLIARAECERAFHRPVVAAAGPRFVCARCSRAFPCDKALASHATECGAPGGGAHHLRASATILRDDFFHRLDLEDKQQQQMRALPLLGQLKQPPTPSPMKPFEPLAKDLADIPSIISMTKGCFLQQLHAADAGGGGGGGGGERTEEEEAQDVFAVEFRRMKLRGEFPCRLCASVFPNLRALKGHNRTHLNAAAHSGTYRCNMCPHASLDKAALIRHMRTHNGDRPYECALCNYAFTTKANCERHLRNRHAKTTRDEVKSSIIYHPSEDPTNEDINKQLGAKQKQQQQQQLNTSATSSIDSADLPARSSTPLSVAAFPDAAQLNKDLSAMFSALTPKPPPPPAPAPAPTEGQFTTSTPHKSAPSIRVKDVNVLKHIPEQDAEADEEEAEEDDNSDNSDDESADDDGDVEMSEPMDLSKKRSQLEAAPPCTPQFPMSELLTQQLLKAAPQPAALPPSAPAADPSLSLYAHLASLCRGGFPNYFPGFPIGPLMMPPVAAEARDRLQRQLSGGGIKAVVYPPASYAAFFGDVKLPAEGGGSGPKVAADLEPLSVHVDGKASPAAVKSEPQQQQQQLQSPNAVKMVIKNGVLMPKQKQRRYRTERPFSCEHCAARFTLRSNMERHIKQQHPQYWSQRQRAAGMGAPGRKPPPPPPPTMAPYETAAAADDGGARSAISDKLKYAILAQHLRAAHDIKKEEKEAEEDALVIDEVAAEAPKSRILEEKLKELRDKQSEQQQQQQLVKKRHDDAAQDLVSVTRLLVNASQQQHQLKEYFRPEHEELNEEANSEEDEEGLVASGSTSEGNSGTDENRSESDNVANPPEKKKSAYSLAPNRVSCPYCSRKFPWTSSLRRHILTHTGQKPFKCSHCPLLFTTKSNCDRHLLRKHGNAATTISNAGDAAAAAAGSFMMRNVPERPFKCATCPSSTFSTYSNLKKHMIAKHGAQDDRQGYEAGSSEDEKNGSDHRSEWEAQVAHGKAAAVAAAAAAAAAAMAMVPVPPAPPESAQATTPTSDLPFKCHLCDSSFGERQECLDHIRDKHAPEYELLMSKNALDPNASTPDEGNQHEDDEKDVEGGGGGGGGGGGVRGKFPDYSNRKVICAFCMRRFWSAEDLRRHMRTHTGERPFSCDICRRRFTLKHSMLRHRKKHNLAFDADANQSDEEGFDKKPAGGALVVSNEERRDALADERERDDSDANEGNDLISNLLGIRDRSLIEQVLTASADDAAKLLGVGN